MKQLFFLFFLFVLPFSAFSTHIVGGEIELEHLQDSTYEMRLFLYVDDLHGNQSAIDPLVRIHIFSKADNKLMEVFELPLVGSEPVAYTQPECTRNDLKTSKKIYRKTVILHSSIYRNASGYYAVWERCCRNDIISNISHPDSAAQVFYTEFPAIVRNGESFINSTPSLFPPLSDFACAREPYYINFKGADKDGDILVYKMAVPWTGENATYDRPRPDNMLPAPYKEVVWANGASNEHEIPGNPPLSVSSDGFLSVASDKAGLFVFAVVCEEYRNGIKIGEVRRDFQLMVVDCPPQNPPQIVSLVNASSVYGEGDTIRYVQGNAPCLALLATDIDDNTTLKVRANDYYTITPPSIGIQGGDTASFRLCLTSCPTSGLKLVQVILEDGACPFELTDTISFYIEVLPKEDAPPVVEVPFDYVADSGYYKASMLLGQTIDFTIKATDADGDSLFLGWNGGNLEALQVLGAIYQDNSGLGALESPFHWKADCPLVLADGESIFYDIPFKVFSYDS